MRRHHRSQFFLIRPFNSFESYNYVMAIMKGWAYDDRMMIDYRNDGTRSVFFDRVHRYS